MEGVGCLDAEIDWKNSLGSEKEEREGSVREKGGADDCSSGETLPAKVPTWDAHSL